MTITREHLIDLFTARIEQITAAITKLGDDTPLAAVLAGARGTYRIALDKLASQQMTLPELRDQLNPDLSTLDAFWNELPGLVACTEIVRIIDGGAL